MLAQSFLSADDLNITEPQRQALVKVLVLLETGKLKHTPSVSVHGGLGRDFSGHFNMCNWAGKNRCGTVACIGGTAELVGNVSFGDIYSDTLNPGLRALFMPSHPRPGYWSDITPAQAATALRSYLTTGDARWDLAVQ